MATAETASGVFVCSTPARGSVAPSVRIIASTTPSTIYSGSSTSASSSSSSLTTTSTSTCVTASPKSRKRKRRSKQWARKKMKAQRNSGKEYTSAKKLLVNAKKISPTPCACKLKCCSRITTVQRNTYLILMHKMHTFVGALKLLTRNDDTRHRQTPLAINTVGCFIRTDKEFLLGCVKSCFYVHLPFQMGAWTEH